MTTTPTPDRAAVEILYSLMRLGSVEERVHASALAMRVAIETNFLSSNPPANTWHPWSQQYRKATRS